ncbi:mechanosensitive ion channel [Candidatus Woesearchaeota archaeon]|nr:mechanosensitive ion channel [Candidatus Woesearchaeota archaeon]
MAVYDFVFAGMAWFIETIGVAIISLFLGFILANGAARLAQEVFAHAEVNRLLRKTGVMADVEQFLVRLVRISAYAVTCLLVLWHLGMLWYVTVAVLGLLIVFCVAEILINLLDILPNVLFGLLVMRRRRYVAGQEVRVDGVAGRVRNVYLTELTVSTPNGDMISVPYWYLYRQK